MERGAVHGFEEIWRNFVWIKCRLRFPGEFKPYIHMNPIKLFTIVTNRIQPLGAIVVLTFTFMMLAVFMPFADAENGRNGSHDQAHRGSQQSQDRGLGLHRDRAPNLEGSWLQTVVQEGGPEPFKALASFSAGGAMTLSISLSPTQSAFHGTWKRTGRRTYVWSGQSFAYDDDGVFGATVHVRDEITLARDGNSFTGTGHVRVVGLDGTVFVDAPSTVEAERIHP